jgi:hypothetical protein
MKRILGMALVLLSSATLFFACGENEPAIPNDTVAKLTSQAVFSSARAPDSVDANTAAPRAVTITGENGGTAYLDFNLNLFNLFGFLSGSGTIDFTDWVVIDDADTPDSAEDDLSYAIDNQLTIDWDNDYDFSDAGAESTLSMTSTYNIEGSLQVSNDVDEVTADLDLTTVYTYSCTYSDADNSVTITCTAATTGTVNDEDVTRNFSFASEIGLPTIDITIGA